MRHTFRARGDIATVTVTCDNDEQHVVTLNIDGTITTQHDVDTDAVLFALGGEQHACRKAENSYEAAVIADLALRGIQDVPGVRSFRQMLQVEKYCRHCQRTRRDGTVIGTAEWSHFTEPAHLAEAYGGDQRLILALSRWIARRVPDANRTNSRRVTPALNDAILASSSTGGSNYHSSVASRLAITPRLLRAYTTLTQGRAADGFVAVMHLRNAGIRVEWLTHLAENVTPRAVERAIRAHGDDMEAFMSSLTLSRHVPAETVAEYLNAGITTHFHTYARHRATKEQILAVYAASGGNKSLADYLKDGVSIPDALVDAPRHRSAA